MSAEENYPADIAVSLPNFCFCDKQYIGTSFDRVRRKLMYTSTITEKTRIAGKVTETNTTGQTLWSGLTSTPPGHPIDLEYEFVLQTAIKDIDSGDVSFYSSYDSAQIVPTGFGAGGLVSFTLVPGTGFDTGTYTYVKLGGGTGYSATATVVVVAGVVTSVTLLGIGYGYSVGDVLTFPSILTSGHIVLTAVNTGSDGSTWGRSVGDTNLTQGGNVLSITDPRNGNFWVHVESCELHLFQPKYDYAMTISPLQMPYSEGPNPGILGGPIGLNTDWVYFWASTSGDDRLQILPSSITPTEIAADQLLATYTYNYPDSNYYYRQIIGADGLLYVFGALNAGTRTYKLWKAEPGVGFTEITSWSSSTGPNTDCAGWTTSNYAYPYMQNYLVQLPATSEIVLISKLLPANYNPTSSDPIHFRVDCTYYNTVSGDFDYHQEMVYGYMDADWKPTDLAGAAWWVYDFLEFDNDLECSDFQHNVDYTTRRLAFICQAMSGGVVSSSYKSLVFVDYKFVSGSAPEVVQVVSESHWDAKYTTYATAISQAEVVAGSLPVIARDNLNRYPDVNHLADNGVWDRDNSIMWLSGDQPQFCEFSADFTARLTQAEAAWSARNTAANSPFLKLSIVEGQPPNILLWTFELDGHEYLVVPLQDETLIYDFLSQEWYSWGNGDTPIWAPQHGQNWNANLGNVLNPLGGKRVSNVICGDRSTGALYFLDPELNEDYSNAGVSGQKFKRVITGQLVSRSQDYTMLPLVSVTASDGGAVVASDLTVTLEGSDDEGHTYYSFGTKTVTLGDYAKELSWRSLGSYNNPGRLLRLTDYGALVRIDDWSTLDPPGQT